MVKAELSYNPYLLETVIRFNGKEPRINSLVEKYNDTILQNWINDVPRIFYDEMNGYNFELEFTGTGRDFKELEKSFLQANVTKEQVTLFHKRELEDRKTKLEKIDSLLAWLQAHSNKNFDNEGFRAENEVLFDASYSIVLIQGERTEAPNIEWADATVEIITDIKALNNTDLVYTPIIIVVDSNTIEELQGWIKYLNRRLDVSPQQLFFVVDSNLNQETVYRVVKDLGVRKPIIIDSFEDEKLKKYFEIYPETDYIINSIKSFKLKIDEISETVAEERVEGEKANTEISESINTKNQEIREILEVIETLSAKQQFDKPASFVFAKKKLDERVFSWRKKKTKCIQKEEAEKLAEELIHVVNRALKEYTNALHVSIAEIKEGINQAKVAIYMESGLTDDFSAENVELDKPEPTEITDFKSDLMEMKVEEKVLKHAVGFFYIPSKNQDDDYEIQSAYYMQKWREEASSILEPITKKLAMECMEAISKYNDVVTNIYMEHLDRAVVNKREEIEELTKQLSDEEKQIQQDTEWMNEFKQQLRSIERG